MRRRATFIPDSPDQFDPKEVQLKGRQLLYPGLKAAREERLTFGFDELPPELLDVLQQSSELHIRWISERPYSQRPPFISSTTPGLHVHYTPANRSGNDLLCPLLREAFSHELKCESPNVSFTQPDVLSERFSTASSLQYYSVLPKLVSLVRYLQRRVCAPSDQVCFHTAALLNAADYVDLDYDAISHALVLTSYWSKSLPAIYDPVGGLTTLDQWPLDITSSQNDKVEVGVLSNDEAVVDPHELQLAGVLIVVGEDDVPKATLFSFPSRHHILPPSQPQTYTVSFQHPTGLHPTLQISFPQLSHLTPPTNKPSDSVCGLHTYLTLPSILFPDEYAFRANDPLFGASHNIHSLNSISGELDLEAPDYVVQKWGSTMLLRLADPTTTSASTQNPNSDSWNVTIPLHLRYLPPSTDPTTSHEKITIPWPTVFWACTAEDGTKFPVNPFDRIHLGYDAAFGPRTMFYHLQPRSDSQLSTSEGRLVEVLEVPVLNTGKIGGDQVVEVGTLIVVLSGFLWVIWKVWPALRRVTLLNGGLVDKTRGEKKMQ